MSLPLRLQRDNFVDSMWGGDWIPRLKGLAAGSAPVGESWEFSAHPARPSRVEWNGGRPVTELLSARAAQVLGAGAAARLGGAAPFLVKLIDSRDDISVQVHPGDAYARAHEKDSGKVESWVVVDADPSEDGGHIYLGFDPRRAESFDGPEALGEAFLAALNQANAQGPSLDPDVRAKAARLVLPFLNKVRVKPGDVYDVPPGVVHAIGRGVRLFEIQQSSDVTYRVWDWNRPDAKKLKEGKTVFRELHLERAREVLDFRARPAEAYRRAPVDVSRRGSGRYAVSTLTSDADGRYAAERVRLDDASAWVESPAGFSVLTVLSGSVEINVDGISWGRAAAGESVLVPASAPALTLRGGPAHLIRSYLP